MQHKRERRTLSGEGLERQLVAPRSRSFAGVGADLKDVVGGRLQSVDDDVRLGGVGRPVVGGVAPVVVQQLVQHDLAVAMLPGRRLPLQSHARRADADRREIHRRSGRDYATQQLSTDAVFSFFFVRYLRAGRAIGNLMFAAGSTPGRVRGSVMIPNKLFTQAPASVTKQYNLVPTKGR